MVGPGGACVVGPGGMCGCSGGGMHGCCSGCVVFAGGQVRILLRMHSCLMLLITFCNSQNREL